MYFSPTVERCFIIENIPVVYALPEVASFYPSSVVDQLKRKGIMPIAAELARQNLPMAGRLRFLESNHTGPVGPGSGRRLCDTVHEPTVSALPSEGPGPLLRGGKTAPG